MCVCVLVAQLFFATPWTVALQASWCMGFPRQEYWSGLPFPSPGDLPHPGIEPGSPALQVDSLPSEPPGKPCVCVCVCVYEVFAFNESMRISSADSCSLS